MNINLNTPVGDIVKENFRTSQILNKHNIDFCCGGNLSIEEACKKSKVNVFEILPELEALVLSTDPDSKYLNSLELDELCNYIEKRHHTYVNENIPFLQQNLEKLCGAHGENHPELYDVRDLFEDLAGALSAHMKKEELMLFPAIRKIVKIKQEGLKTNEDLGKVAETINLLEDEHQTEGDRFRKISELTNNYSCPPDGCTTYRITYETLKDFEQDLHKHIHLENNILFKKAISLENLIIREL